MNAPTRPLLFAAAFILAVPALALPRGPLQCREGLAGPYPCHAVDQAGFVPFANTGRVLGWRHEASGREVAVVSLGQEISFVEVTDPEHPEPRGEYRKEYPVFLGATAVYRDYLYVSVLNDGNPEIHIFDMNRVLETEGASTRIQADVIWPVPIFGGLSIVPETGHAFLIAGNIAGLDLSGDPEAPEEILAWDPGPPYTSRLECVLYHGPDSRFAGHEVCTAPAGRRSMVLYDVTPEHPAKLSRTFYKRYNAPWHATFTSDHRFVLLSDSHDEFNPGFNTRTFLFDVTSLTSPSYFASYDGPTKGRDLHIEVRGRYAFLANGTAGLRVLDLRQIAKGRVREVGFFDVEPELNSANWFGAHSLDVLPSGTVIVASLRQGLYILRPRL
jgi:choice-of-anchor B domain-containing protein